MRWVILGAVVTGLAFGITQGVIPGQAEKKVRDRLTKNGGTADVSIRAIPAIRLLFDDGDELDVEAHGIAIPATDLRGGSFKELDGFDEMRFDMVRSEVGPFTADRVLMSRDEGEETYDFMFRGSTSAGQLADFALGSFPPILRSLVETLGGRPADAEIPIRLDAELRSVDGRAELVRGSGTVAGLPLGGIALPIAGAIISRLTG
ncbi:MAG TPA: hypothetical protein VFB51_04160 [Solirubrobacterales bacterium]|nr:hypothetical protein [Solirubrobacterales bacterium]